MGITLVDVEWIVININESQDASNCLMASREGRGVLEEDCTKVHRAACTYTAPGEITSLSSLQWERMGKASIKKNIKKGMI